MVKESSVLLLDNCHMISKKCTIGFWPLQKYQASLQSLVFLAIDFISIDFVSIDVFPL